MPQYDFRVVRTIRIWSGCQPVNETIFQPNRTHSKVAILVRYNHIPSEHAVLDLRDEVQPIIRILQKIVVPLLYEKNNNLDSKPYG